MSIYGRLIAVFVLSVSSFMVFADTYSAVIGYEVLPGYKSSKEEACLVVVISPRVLVVNGMTCESWGLNVNNVLVFKQSWVIYSGFYCPGGGSLSNGMCINSISCIAPQVRNLSSGMCEIPPVCLNSQILVNNVCVFIPICIGDQTPTTFQCRYRSINGLPLNCANGSTVYAPDMCPPIDSRWPEFFLYKRPCSPLDIHPDPDQCNLSLFQKFDSFASSHAIQIAVAGLAISSVATLSRLPVVVGGVAIEARVLWDGVFHNSAGEIVDIKVAADIPKSVMGEAVSDFIKNNPNDPFSIKFPVDYNGAAPQAPIVVEPNSGIIHPFDSSIPLSGNQLIDAVKQFEISNPIPLAKIAPYIFPENIPWLSEAAPFLKHDLGVQQSPINYPQLARSPLPQQFESPSYIISPNPFISPAPSRPATPALIEGLDPIPFTPLSPQPISIPIPLTSLPPSNFNPNPLGTDAQKTPYVPPNPLTPIDPAIPELPPEPPTIFPDTFKFFDFLPMHNPFVFDVSNFIPVLPEPNCFYEIHRTFHVPMLGNKSFDLAPCVPLQPLRTVLAWVFSVLSIFTCFFVIFRSSF